MRSPESPKNLVMHTSRIPKELLKNRSLVFRHYLMTFLNKMLEKGNTPEEVNIFKCFLIFKVEGGDSKQPGQYRPIPIPSNILRLLTVRICEKMASIVEEQRLLEEEQLGFHRKRLPLMHVLSSIPLSKRQSERMTICS